MKCEGKGVSRVRGGVCTFLKSLVLFICSSTESDYKGHRISTYSSLCLYMSLLYSPHACLLTAGCWHMLLPAHTPTHLPTLTYKLQEESGKGKTLNFEFLTSFEVFQTSLSFTLSCPSLMCVCSRGGLSAVLHRESFCNRAF